MTRKKILRAAREAFLLAPSDGFHGAVLCSARLDLNKNQGFAARRYDVDFAQFRTVAPGDYPVAFQAQRRLRDEFGDEAFAVGGWARGYIPSFACFRYSASSGDVSRPKTALRSGKRPKHWITCSRSTAASVHSFSFVRSRM